MDKVVATGLRLVCWFVAGCSLIVLGYQVPVRHSVRIGSNDGGYVQGFNDAQNRWGTITDTSSSAPFRWTKAQSFVLFPQVGLPADVTIHWRGPVTKPPSQLHVLLNGTGELGNLAATGTWSTSTFHLTTGFAKPDDLFVELRSDTPSRVSGTVHGIQVDWVELRTTSWPILPVPAQVLQGGLALALLAVAIRRPRTLLLAAAGGLLAWLLFYRLPLTGYPLRHLLRWIILLLAALLAIRHAPALTGQLTVRRAHRIAAVLVVIWLVGVIGDIRAHTVLAAPGVEKDFRVFATRSEQFLCPDHIVLADAPCVLRADGFYQLGYPLLLWLVRPLVHDNPFLAARWVALGSSTVLLLGGYMLGLRLLGPFGGLLTLALAGLNALTVQYTLLLGTDMPFAAAWTLAVAALVWIKAASGRWRLLGTGAVCGLAFVLRHPGILTLPIAWTVLVVLARFRIRERQLWQHIAWLTLGFALVVLPQIGINSWQTGQPLYSQQAKNIWLAVYGNTEWSRWPEASNDVKVLDVVRQEPARFWSNWGHNLQLFFGTGAADTNEWGQAAMLRLLGFPANLLAVAGLLHWAWRRPGRTWLLLTSTLSYVIAVSVGFSLIRFFVPLVALWATAGASALLCLGRRWHVRGWSSHINTGLTLLLLVLLSSEIGSGAAAVLDLQPPADVAIVAAITAQLPAANQIQPRLAPEETLAKYSAIAHRFAADGQYILWSAHSERPKPTGGALLATSGQYQLYRQKTP